MSRNSRKAKPNTLRAHHRVSSTTSLVNTGKDQTACGYTMYQTTKYLEFIPREQGGGFQGELTALIPWLLVQSGMDLKKFCPMAANW